jgi:hypothetical protein
MWRSTWPSPIGNCRRTARKRSFKSYGIYVWRFYGIQLNCISYITCKKSLTFGFLMVSTIFWLAIQCIPRNSDHFDSRWVIVVRLWMNLSLNSMFQLTFELTRVGIHGQWQDLNLINELSMTYPWHFPETITRSLAILLLLLQGVIGVTFCFLRDHLIHQEDPFQSLGSPEDLEEMGDQPPPPNTARFLTESEGHDSTVLSWSSLAICTSHPPIWIMIPPSDVIS